MAFNGSGTFVRIYDWTTDEGNGVNIEASRMDGEDDGFATGLSTCITKDGQTTISANIPFNAKKITGLGNGSARTDSIALGQVQDNTYEYLGENGGAADAYTFTPSPAITAYAAGQSWIAKIGSGDGNTDASTFNISAVADRDLKKSDGAGSVIALESGDLVAGEVYRVTDDGTQGVVENPTKPYLNIDNAVFTSAKIELSNGTDADHDIDFTAGATIASDDSVRIITGALTKQLDSTWAAGTAAGGLADALTIANDTWYHCFALSSSDGTTVDCGFDTSITATNLLADTAVIAAGLTKRKRVGSILTDGSANILAFFQIGNRFSWDILPVDYNASNPGTSVITVTASTPLGVKTIADVTLLCSDASFGGASYFILITDPNATDSSPSSARNHLPIFGPTLGSLIRGSTTNSIRTSSTSTIRFRTSLSDAGITIVIINNGWTDINL